jgi:UDP-N-acetylmuramoyl-tripeptide--D-alanyl-D-alanine ligase
VPADAPELDSCLRGDLDYIRVGQDARLVRFDPPLLEADVLGERVEVEVPFTAGHQAENTVTALAAYAALGLPLRQSGIGAGEIVFSRWRGEELALPGGGILVNDAWNANPVSVKAALAHLVQIAAGRRTVAVLGDMAELGPDGPRYHREVGAEAARLGIDVLVGVGPLASGYVEAAAGETHWAATAQEAVATVRAVARDGDAVLVKGSRSMGMERVAEALALVNAA